MLEIHAHARFAGVLAGDAHERPADVQTCHKGAAQPRQFDGQIAPGATSRTREPESRYAAIRRAVWRISSPSRVVWRAYQAATRPSIPRPLYGLLGAFAVSVLRSPRCAEAIWELQAVCAMSAKRQMACSAAVTGDFVRRDRAGQARPQKNRAPVPGIPGLQQSQFATLGDTETASHWSCKGRAKSEQVRSTLNKSGQHGSNRVKSRQAGQSGRRRRNPGKM